MTNLALDEQVARKGVEALDCLLSHDRDLVVIDPADGTGLLEPEAYGDLFSLFSALREQLGRSGIPAPLEATDAV